MELKDLERRAMLGDRQAQEECTAKEILLPCPFCGCRMRLLEGDSYFGSHLVKCVWCGAGTREAGNKYVAICLANRRPAPPIGKCKDCDCYWPNAEQCGHSGETVKENDFCSKFKPKEAPND